jgi:hypothetical protein
MVDEVPKHNASLLMIATKKTDLMYRENEDKNNNTNVRFNAKPNIGRKKYRGEIKFELKPKSTLHHTKLDAQGRTYQEIAYEYTLEEGSVDQTLLSPSHFVHFYSSDSLVTFPKVRSKLFKNTIYNLT